MREERRATSTNARKISEGSDSRGSRTSLRTSHLDKRKKYKVMVSRARSQKSTRDERASIERRWCSFDVGERDTDDAKILHDIMRRNAPPRGGMGIRAAFTRGEETKGGGGGGQAFCARGMRLSKTYENAGHRG
ncbi:hypothetical protein K438DRAFT_1762358 [Mycena galopus ATCC 62051]|nr:hypothetical protein K438DRAFT_1762358 [Mycena galopus ATCC 62051]